MSAPYVDPVLGIMHYTDEDAETAVFLALGAASVCWDEGVFQSERAKQIGEDLIAHLRRLRLMPDEVADAVRGIGPRWDEADYDPTDAELERSWNGPDAHEAHRAAWALHQETRA